MSAPRVDTSVYQRVLGARFDDLDPALQRYFGPIPRGMAGVGEGVYEVAGSRRRWLRGPLALLARRRILFPEYEQDVPLGVVNTSNADGTLSARRTFAFAGVERQMEDTMRVVGGTLVDRLGVGRELEVELALVVHDGGLTMTSRRLALRVLGLRVPLPHFATVVVCERSDGLSQRVDVRISVPVVGEVFRYAGTFSYRHVAIADLGATPPATTDAATREGRGIRSSRDRGQRDAVSPTPRSAS
ncbi:DUF4166 domain-containing protein [Microbacterium sp. CFBP9034]|uniref:DUF4166 domain-containing protein n=1 Tax=Microbacterium sp. CFBP9034 TaxID=3096540 RepID=UPI002A6AA200|nr:DUF4166 domain-containing protein [Microbacterium sp. CFBP9034]MDY0908921.1 DUF4166 domain-containing protein [Microbacterium sp. CFBP9034]